MAIKKAKPKNVAEVEAPDYTKWLPRWKLVDDLISSDNLTSHIRDHVTSAQKSGGSGFMTEVTERGSGPVNIFDQDIINKRYKERAVYMNVVGNTLDGMVGLSFSNPPEQVLPPELEILRDNADGTGLTLEQQAQEILRGVMMFGRVGVLVDFPKTDGKVSKAQMEDIFPTLLYYPAKHVREWRTTARGSKVVPSLIVLSTFSREDDLAGEIVESRLALGLDKSGYYYQEKFEVMEKGGKKSWVSQGVKHPTDYAGKYMTEIPWVWAGAETNSHRIDTPPLLNIANINKAHYNTSAIYEDSVYMCGQPQPWMSGVEQHQLEQMIHSGFRLGAGQLIAVAAEGQFSFAQVEPNTLASESLKDKLQMMLTMGARLIQPNVASVVRTATEVLSENVTQNSVLSLASNNTSDAITKALEFAQQFVGGTGKIAFAIDTSFAVAKPDGLTLDLLVKAWATGGIALEDLWDWQVKNRFTQLEFEAWKSQLRSPEIVATDPNDGEGTPKPNDGEKVDET